MTVHALALPVDAGDGTSTDTAEVFRQSLGALVYQGGAPMEARSGLFPSGGNPAGLSGASAMSANIAPCSAWVDGTSGTNQGGYLLVSTAAELITFADGETGVARVDRVIAQVEHDTYDASGQRRARIRYLKGQASGVATALPASSLLLWEMTVPAGTSSGSGGLNFANAVDKRTFTATRGGMLPVANQTERDALPSPHVGQQIWRTDYGWQEIYDGTAWRVQGVAPVPASANLTRVTNPLTGQLAIATSTAQVYRYNGTVWVTYPTFGTVAVDVLNTSRGSTIATSYTSALSTSTDDPITLTFTAPTSGAVWVTVSARIDPAGEAFATFQIATSPGGVVTVAANDARAVSSSWNGPVRATRRCYVAGLTAGQLYSCTMMFRVQSGLAEFDGNDLIVEPSLS